MNEGWEDTNGDDLNLFGLSWLRGDFQFWNRGDTV